MKQTIALVFTIFICFEICHAQPNQKTKANAFSLELGKIGLVYNINFDHKLKETKFGYRFGIGSNFSKNLNAITIGSGCYYHIGSRNRFLELGADLQYLVIDEVSNDQKGFTFIYPDYSVKTLYPSINLGYRLYGERTLFRIGLSPCIIESKFFPGGYISYGIRF